ncbi:MAG TPA: hypothetical protein VEL31_30975 [Ktedonobacteraceae bacterium]|nr:hypothetical protein [Ktedonobacteraceae bacterium]
MSALFIASACTRRARTVPSILISCSAEAGGQPLMVHLTLE